MSWKGWLKCPQFIFWTCSQYQFSHRNILVSQYSNSQRTASLEVSNVQSTLSLKSHIHLKSWEAKKLPSFFFRCLLLFIKTYNGHFKVPVKLGSRVLVADKEFQRVWMLVFKWFVIFDVRDFRSNNDSWHLMFAEFCYEVVPLASNKIFEQFCFEISGSKHCFLTFFLPLGIRVSRIRNELDGRYMQIIYNK